MRARELPKEYNRLRNEQGGEEKEERSEERDLIYSLFAYASVSLIPAGACFAIVVS